MTDEERLVVFELFRNGCPAELPENVHINIDLLRRSTGFETPKLKRILGSLNSLGFRLSLRDDDETSDEQIGEAQILVLEWHDMSVEMMENATAIASAMILCATKGYCENHGRQALERLDFSQLASVTTVVDEH